MTDIRFSFSWDCDKFDFIGGSLPHRLPTKYSYSWWKIMARGETKLPIHLANLRNISDSSASSWQVSGSRVLIAARMARKLITACSSLGMAVVKGPLHSSNSITSRSVIMAHGIVYLGGWCQTIFGRAPIRMACVFYLSGSAVTYRADAFFDWLADVGVNFVSDIISV